MQLPADLRKAGLDIGTAAAAGTYAAATVVAAPGAGARLRIWGVWSAPNAIMIGAQSWHVQFLDPAGGPSLMRFFGVAPGPGDSQLFPGGLVLTANTLLQAVYASSIAGPQSYRLGAWYTIEAVP